MHERIRLNTLDRTLRKDPTVFSIRCRLNFDVLVSKWESFQETWKGDIPSKPKQIYYRDAGSTERQLKDVKRSPRNKT